MKTTLLHRRVYIIYISSQNFNMNITYYSSNS